METGDGEGTHNDPEEEGEAKEDVNMNGGPQFNNVIREFDTHVASMIWMGQVHIYYCFK